MGRAVGTAARPRDIILVEVFPNVHVRAAFIVYAISSGRAGRGGRTTRKDIHGVLTAGIVRELDFGMIWLTRRSIGEGHDHPIAPGRRFDFASETNRCANGNIGRRSSRARIGKRIRRAFTTIQNAIRDIDKTRLASRDLATTAPTSPRRYTASARKLCRTCR